nr:AMP-binding protein [Nocardioides humi]
MSSAQFERELTALPSLLRRNASLAPDRVSVIYEDGTTWTAKESLEWAHGAAASLRQLGVRHGDRVALALPSGPSFLRAWWGPPCSGRSWSR